MPVRRKGQQAGKRFVLDTSALLALRGDESGAERVQALLESAMRQECRLFVSFMTRMEMLYCIRRQEGEDEANQALRLVDSFSVEWISCEPAILERAVEIKASGGLSIADSWIAATARASSAILVHRDPEFAAVPDLPQELLE
jgi:predicted nucleic acid-binding protein